MEILIGAILATVVILGISQIRKKAFQEGYDTGFVNGLEKGWKKSGIEIGEN